MVRRHELTDAQWQRIGPLLPAHGKPGGQWADHRKVINGVLFRARTGVPWPDPPERYGPWQTVYERHRRWSADGTWQRILAGLQIEADAADPDGQLAQAVERESRQRTREWAVNIDSTSCRAHHYALNPAAGWGLVLSVGVGLVLVGWDVADRCVEVLVVEPVDPSPAFDRGCPHRGGEFATAAGPATRTGPAAGCSPDRGQPLTVMFELPLLW